MASGWNLTVLNPFGTGFTLQWTQLPANINRVARFYIILVKSTQGSILDVETLPESILTLTINGRRPSTKYRVVVYGVDDEGQLYKSEESLASTTESMNYELLYFFFCLFYLMIERKNILTGQHFLKRFELD